MNLINVFDERKNRDIGLVIQADNSIEGEYFRQTFPDATGLLFKDGNSNKFVRFHEQ